MEAPSDAALITQRLSWIRFHKPTRTVEPIKNQAKNCCAGSPLEISSKKRQQGKTTKMMKNTKRHPIVTMSFPFGSFSMVNKLWPSLKAV